MSVKIKVIALVGATNHRSYGPLKEGKAYEIDVRRFGDKIFKPKSREDKKVLEKYIASLNKTEEVAAAPPEGKIEEDSSNG
jgi:hypothetical protein